MTYYFDNCATSRADDDVMAILDKYQRETYYNPSARSSFSLAVARELKSARESIAKTMGVTADEIYFTSGGTESDNIAIFGSGKSKSGNVVVTASEHSAVYNAVMKLGDRGYEVRLANVTCDGHIDADDFVSKVDDNTVLACFMHVNNETGAINDVKNINRLVKAVNPRTLTLSDGVQAVGKIHVNLRSLGVDFYSMSGHKIHGSKGTGFLYVKRGTKCTPILFGGGQENGMRSGTENVPGIAGLAKAAEMLYSRFDEDHARLCACKRRFIEGVRELDQVTVNGLLPDAPYGEGTAAHIVSVSFAGVRSEVLLHALEDKGIYVSAGSACSAHKPQPSAALKAIGVDKSLLDSTIRFSFSVFTTEEEIDVCLRALYNIVPMLRRYSRR